MVKIHQPGAVATLLLALAPFLAAAAAGHEEWRLPAAGLAQLFSWDDVVIEDAHSVPLVGLAFLAEDTTERRVHSDFTGHQNATAKGTGLGAGSGRGGLQKTFADANTAANQNATKTTQTQSVRGAATAKTKQPLMTRSWFGWMRFYLTTAFVVKSLCMMCNIFYQASPLPLINEFNVKGDTGGADLAPFIAVAYGGWQWCFYGLFAYIVTSKSGFLVLVYSNVVGATLGLYYVYAFTLNCNNTAMIQRSSKYYYVLACIAAVQVCAILELQAVKALFLCGLISSCWSMIASLSLISTVPVVYENKSSKSLPVPLLVMGEISAVLWIVCGVMLWDPWITFPNCFAFLVCSFALYLCWQFPVPCSDFDSLSRAASCRSLSNDDATAAVAAAAAAAKAAELEDAAREFDPSRTSPLQRALEFVTRSTVDDERAPLNNPLHSSRLYGGTGGTGDW